MAKDSGPRHRRPPSAEPEALLLPAGIIQGHRVEFKEHLCAECGVKFAIEYAYDRLIRQGDRDDDGEYEPRVLFCPNGHELEFPEPPLEEAPRVTIRKLKHENAKLRREVGQLKHDREVSEAEASTARAECELLYAVAVDVCPDRRAFTDALAKRRGGQTDDSAERPRAGRPAPSRASPKRPGTRGRAKDNGKST